MTAPTRNPCLFVVGCPRSGTTLLQRMLDHHPLLAVANDTHFIPRVLEKLSPDAVADATEGRSLALSPELIQGVRSYHRFGRLGLSDSFVEQAADNCQNYGDFVEALYMEYGRLRDKPLAGEKTPDYVRHLPLLHGLFPQAKTVHIIRDGRDVGLSTLEWATEKKGPGRMALWKEEPVAVCALWWRWLVTTGRADGRRLGADRYVEVAYEQLSHDPATTLHKIADFLQIPFREAMLRFHEGKMSAKPGKSAKSAWLPATPGLRDWRSDMSQRDLQLFEALAGDALSECGYQRGAESISPDVAVVAERCREWWKENTREGRGG